jgi:transcription elongation factor
MRTKVLLSLAAFAASALAAYAQSNVYSVNIVGYVNQTNVAGNFSLIHNPLDDGAGNRLTNVLKGALAGSEAYVWNGSGYSVFSVGAKTGTWNGDTALPPGTGLFVKPATAALPVTYVGEVVAGPGETVTNALTGGTFDLTGALIPYATTNHATDAKFGLVGAAAGSELYKWTGLGYAVSSVGAKTGTWSPGLQISVGEAFFIKPAANFDWKQTLPAN